MPSVVPAIIGGAAAIYGANKVGKATDRQADIAQMGLDASLAPRRTQYGSYTGPLRGFAPPAAPAAPAVPAPTGIFGQTGMFNSGMSGRGGSMSTGGMGSFLRPQQKPSAIYDQEGNFLGNPGDRFTFLDPSIRAMRERSLENVPNYQSILRPQLNSTLEGLGQTRGRLDDLYGQFNDNAFMDPILQRLALARGQLGRGLVNRGLGGSSFEASALGNFDSAAAPGIAQARQMGLEARQGLLGSIANTDVQSLSAAGQGVAQLQNLDNLYASVSGQNLQQELAALGLSQADINGILGASQQIGQAGLINAQTSGNLMAGLGDLLAKIKLPSGGTPYNPSAGQYGGIA